MSGTPEESGVRAPVNSGSKELGRARNVPAFKTSLLFFFFFTAWNETRAWSTQDWGTSLTPLSLFLISQIQRQRTKNQNVPLPFCSFLPSGPKRQGPRGLSSRRSCPPLQGTLEFQAPPKDDLLPASLRSPRPHRGLLPSQQPARPAGFLRTPGLQDGVGRATEG